MGKMSKVSLPNFKIIDFDPRYVEDFYDLNMEWLETYFYVEPFDKEVLSKPEVYITGRGGYIFFVLMKDRVIGTVALMPTEDPSMLELTKMAVLPEFRGKKIGQALMKHCIGFAAKKNIRALLIYSNTILENAIYIYKKYGFREIPIEQDSPYKRGNIKLILKLD